MIKPIKNFINIEKDLNDIGISATVSNGDKIQEIIYMLCVEVINLKHELKEIKKEINGGI